MSFSTRKSLCIAFLIKVIKREFSKISDPRQFSQRQIIPLSDHLMSGLTIFRLKFSSLFEYDRAKANLLIAKNLKDLYLVRTPPSRTCAS